MITLDNAEMYTRETTTIELDMLEVCKIAIGLDILHTYMIHRQCDTRYVNHHSALLRHKNESNVCAAYTLFSENDDIEEHQKSSLALATDNVILM